MDPGQAAERAWQEGALEIKRPALRYFGGKFRLAPWIISHFPEHTTYVEPYVGGGSVFLRKPPSAIEVINDLDGDVVNFFLCLRDQPEELVRMIELTPYSRRIFDWAFSPKAKKTDLERALAFYVRCWQAYGGRRRSRTGWRTGARGQNKAASVVHDWKNIEHLPVIARRLKDAHVENSPALEVIARFDGPDTLFYVDPPYPRTVRSEQWATEAYAHEMTDLEHEELAAALHDVQGHVIISTIPNKLYAGLFAGWNSVRKGSYTGMGAGPGRKYYEEILLAPAIKPVREFNRQQGIMFKEPK